MTKIFYLLLFTTSLSRICASMYGRIRSPLARAVYTRMLNDEEERQSSHEEVIVTVIVFTSQSVHQGPICEC